MSKQEKQKICPICNNKLTFLKATLKDGIKVCSNHVVIEAGLILKETIEQSTVEDIKERIELVKTRQKESEKVINDFVVSKQIGNFVAFDESQKKWATLSSILGNVENIYNYSDIANFELLEDGESVASGGLGRALVGGALFGGAGAIVGGVTGSKKTKGICNSLRLKITVNDMKNPVVYINFIEKKTKKSGLTYKTISDLAQESLSTFQLICDNREDKPEEQSLSASDEILKYKNLLDAGAITEEEYNSKKKQLLDL